MSSVPAGPSTVDGIKRRAKRIKRELGIPHHEALDLAARQAGFQNIRHAQSAVPHSPNPLFPAFLTAYWASRGGAGRETLQVALSKPLLELATQRQITASRHLSPFHVESPDHLERSVDLDTQEQARSTLFAAARSLKFMDATGLRPTTRRSEDARMRVFDDLPDRDHESRWLHHETGAWVYMDEPYPQALRSTRESWAVSKGLQMITPTWPGLYYPGSTKPFLFCASASFARLLEESVRRLHASAQDLPWNGDSAPYRSHFTSPARQITGRPRRSRPMPAYSKINGALPYGARRGGEKSLWRPAQRMPLNLHLTIGPLLQALDHSPIAQQQRSVIGRVRSTLDDWLQMEYPTEEEMSGEQFHEAYYGTYHGPIGDPKKQIEALVKVVDLLRNGYAECAPRRQLIQRLDSVTGNLAKRAGLEAR